MSIKVEAAQRLCADLKAHTLRNTAIDDIKADIADLNTLIKLCKDDDRKMVLITRLHCKQIQLEDW